MAGELAPSEIFETILADVALIVKFGRGAMMFEFGEESPAGRVEANDEERSQLLKVHEALSRAAISSPAGGALIDSAGNRIALPEPLFHILRHAAAMLVRGERIALAPVSEELSSQEAADLLGVSRPHLIKLLDTGEMPYTKTGRHRRVRFGDVNDYRNRRDAERRERLRDLIRKTEELGLYELEEFDLAPIR